MVRYSNDIVCGPRRIWCDDEFRESVLVGQVLGKNQLGIGDGWIALRVEQFIKEGLLLPITTPAPNAPIYHRMLKKIK